MDEGQSIAQEPAHMAEGQSIAQEPAPTDDAAYRTFYRRFVPHLVAYLMELGARQPEAVVIAQKAMVEAAKHRSAISDFDEYVKGIAFQEWNRRIACAEEHPADEMPEHSSLLSPTLDTTAWEKHERYEIVRALNLLPPRQRQIMVRHITGYTTAEIAHELKITTEEVLDNLKQARKTLAQHITEQER